jgi:hypothetical protein
VPVGLQRRWCVHPKPSSHSCRSHLEPSILGCSRTPGEVGPPTAPSGSRWSTRPLTEVSRGRHRMLQHEHFNRPRCRERSADQPLRGS